MTSPARRRQNRKRVRPPGSAAKVTIAERASMRYTFHGGGPCDGALNGAVMPDPLSSGSAGQPPSAHAFAIRATAPGSVTRAASPSTTTSASRIDTAIEHRESRATLRAFSVLAPVWNQNASSSHRAPTAVTCGLPSSLTVDSQVVRELTASGAGADPAASFATIAGQSTGGSPSTVPRLMISTRRPFICPGHILADGISYVRRATTAELIADVVTLLGGLGRDTVRGEWADTAVGLDGNDANIAVLQTPDGHGRLELFESIHHPDAIETEPTRPTRSACTRGLLGRRHRRGPRDRREARLPPTARRGDVRGRVQAHLRPRPQRHPRDARRADEEQLTSSGAGSSVETATCRRAQSELARSVNGRPAGSRSASKTDGRPTSGRRQVAQIGHSATPAPRCVWPGCLFLLWAFQALSLPGDREEHRPPRTRGHGVGGFGRIAETRPGRGGAETRCILPCPEVPRPDLRLQSGPWREPRRSNHVRQRQDQHLHHVGRRPGQRGRGRPHLRKPCAVDDGTSA